MNIKRYLFIVLSLLPLKSVAFSATNKIAALEADDLLNLDVGDPENLELKSKLFFPYQTRIHKLDAINRYASKNPLLSQEDLEKEFDLVIQEMIEKKLIQINGDQIYSAVPSYTGD